MGKITTITVTAYKSDRINARQDTMRAQRYNADTWRWWQQGYALLESAAHTPYSIYQLQVETFETHESGAPSEFFRAVCPRRYSYEQLIGDLYLALKLLGAEGLPATLAAAYDDSNVRHLIRRKYPWREVVQA